MLSRRAILPLAAVAIGASLVPTMRSVDSDALTIIERSGKITQRFGRASERDIAAYEALYDTRLSDGYRAFLQRENGLLFSFDGDDAKKVPDVGGALTDMNTFFGIGNGDPDNDLMLLTPKMGFWNKRFLPFAPVLGLGGDFCTYAEIRGGKYDGHIMYTDGEVYSGFADAPIAGKPVDELVEGFMTAGWFIPVANSFAALLADYARMA